MLLGFLPLTAGRYTLETVPPTPQPDPVRPDATALARVAWTPQDALIFDSTARGNLALAMQGLSVLPVLGGYDAALGAGRIFSYDVTGGCYEEQEHHSVGSGSLFARGALKKLWRPGLDREAAVRVALEALYDAADDDSATGGPDVWGAGAVSSSSPA